MPDPPAAAGPAASHLPVRVALIGYGLAGAAFHAPLIEANPDLELVSVVTGDPERAKRAREAHHTAAVLASVEEIWLRAAEHDLVVVAAPNRAHVPLGLAALGAGLPLVVDKPLAASADDGRRLEAAARERGLMLAVFHNRRWDADMLTVQRLVDGGALGDVQRFESRFERWRPERAVGVWRELGDVAEAGGVLFDLGSHLVDQAVLLFGRALQVYAELDRRRHGAEVDDDCFIALAHPSGVRSHLWTSHTAAQLGPRMRVLGSRAAYVKWGLDPQEAPLRVGQRPGGPEWGREPPERWGRLGAGDELEPVETEAGAYQRFYEGVVAALREGAPPPVSAREAIEVLEVLEAARESARSGRVVQL
jgi:predicted dehydrogenase